MSSQRTSSLRRAADMLLPGGRGSCRAKAKLGRSLALPNEDLARRFQPAARLNGPCYLKGPCSGVTLVEVTISAMIMGILAAVALPIYSNSLSRYRVDVTAQRIVQDILRTQRLARQTNSTRTIVFTLIDHSYAISGLSSLDRVSQPYQVVVKQPPYGAEFLSLVTAAQPATQLASVSIAFDRFGMPDQGISVTVRSGVYQKRVDVAPTSARVSVQ